MTLREDDTPVVKGVLAVVLGLTLPVACDAGATTAEVLPTPVTGVVTSVHAERGHCAATGCRFAYTLKLTNPMDRDAQVESCNVTGSQASLPLNAVGGAYLKAGATGTFGGNFVLRLTKRTGEMLVSSAVTCAGLDWHGEPPI